jgi:hypothetical protein
VKEREHGEEEKEEASEEARDQAGQATKAPEGAREEVSQVRRVRARFAARKNRMPSRELGRAILLVQAHLARVRRFLTRKHP